MKDTRLVALGACLFASNVVALDYAIGHTTWMGAFFHNPFLMVKQRMRPFVVSMEADRVAAKHNVNITYFIMHDWCNTGPALEDFLYATEAMEVESRDLVAWIGPCVEGVVTIASLATVFDLTQVVATGTTDPSLSSKDRYPFFNRLVETASAAFGSLSNILSSNDWHLISIATEDSTDSRQDALYLKEMVPLYNISVDTEVIGSVDRSDETTDLLAYADFIDKAELLSDINFQNARIVVLLVFNLADAAVIELETRKAVPWSHDLITVTTRWLPESFPSGGRLITVQSKGGSATAIDSMCEKVTNEFYDWYEASRSKDWYHRFSTPTYKDTNWKAAWDYGFVNRTHIEEEPTAWTCESLHEYSFPAFAPMDEGSYTMLALDKMLSAGADPRNAQEWQPFLRQQPEYDGLLGPFTLDENGDRVSSSQMCFVPSTQESNIKFKSCCREVIGSAVHDISSCEYPDGDAGYTSVAPISTLPPRAPLPPTTRRGPLGTTQVLFTLSNLRGLVAVSLHLLFDDGDSVTKMTIEDASELASGIYTPTGLRDTQYDLTIVSETIAGQSPPSDPTLFVYVSIFTPCTDPEYSCLGGYGDCDPTSGICLCEEGTVLAAMAKQEDADVSDLIQVAYEESGEVPSEWRTCILDVASSAQAREFWTMSLWLSAWGLLFSVWLGWEFIFNHQLKYPNTMMQAFISFAVPDVLLSITNFIVYTVQLVNQRSLGSPTGSGGDGYNEPACAAVAFIVYFIIVCTYQAPFTVSLLTYLKFQKIAQGQSTFAIPTAALLSLCLGFPLALGTILAACTYATQADDGYSVLGSYRGLYCFIRRWEPPITMAVIIIFVLSVFLTTLFYIMAAVKVTAVVKKAGTESKAPRAIMRRGLFLTGNFLLWWIWFVVTSSISATGNVVPVVTDYIGAILINAQPIIDAWVIIWMPNVRQAMLQRHLAALGISSSSSSSSSFQS